MDQSASTLEIKASSAAPDDVPQLFGQFMNAFEAFKQTNDERLTELEKRGQADPLISQKLDRIDRALNLRQSALDAAIVERSRPMLDTGMSSEPDGYKDAFSAYVKRGEEKALSVGSNPDGGYLVPSETEVSISSLLREVSPIRAISGVRQISTNVYKRPITTTGPATGWVGETDVRPETASQVLSELSYPTMELYAMPAATSAFLDDAAVDVGQWIADEVNAAFAEQETAAFVTGNGINKPTGFLAAPSVAETSWSWGNLGYVATGTVGGLPLGTESDVLIDLVYTLKSGYRQNASWVMNRRTQAMIRKLKDVDGNYLWQPAATPEGQATFMGFKLVETETMPDVGTDSLSIAFGDFRRGYLIVDRQGVNVLRDPYSSKPYVLFYTTKRVGGGVSDFDAIKLLKFSLA